MSTEPEPGNPTRPLPTVPFTEENLTARAEALGYGERMEDIDLRYIAMQEPDTRDIWLQFDIGVYLGSIVPVGTKIVNSH